MTTLQSGAPISGDDANIEINELNQIKKEWFKLDESLIRILQPQATNKINFFKSDKNAFLFSKADVLEYLSDDAEYFLIILAAHSDEVPVPSGLEDKFEPGTPTVIVTGVKKVKDSNPAEFKTTFRGPNGEPAQEWPDQYTAEVLPNLTDDEIFFQISE